MAAKRIGHELSSMKKIKLLSLVSTALVGLTQPVWAGPHGGGGGFAGGGHFGGGGHFSGGGHFGGGFRAAPAFSGGGARFGGRSVGGLARGPQFSYGGGRMSAVRSYGFTGSASRSITPYADRRTTITHQPNRVGSIAGRSGVSNSRVSTGSSRQSFIKNHAFTRHDANWHRDWDRRHAHFDHGHTFVFIDGFWWGLDPGFYPFDAYANGSNPYDYYNGYPSDYNGDYDGDNGYYDDPGYGTSDQYENNETVSAVQSQLAKLGYYRGAIDGTLGDETEDAIARYEEDHDLSVTGTVTAAALQSLGLARGASY
jgi:Putative peptidoglycan binding domain